MKKALFWMFLGSSFCQVCFASEQTGYITNLLVHWPGSGDGKFDVVLNGTMIGQQPGECNSGQWSGYLSNQAGRSQYALLLTALTSGRMVTISGNGYCESTREVIRNVNVVVP